MSPLKTGFTSNELAHVTNLYQPQKLRNYQPQSNFENTNFRIYFINSTIIIIYLLRFNYKKKTKHIISTCKNIPIPN